MRCAWLTLVLFCACTAGAPHSAADRLIGTWAHLALLPGCVERRPEQWVDELEAFVEQAGADTTETFLADGTRINPHRSVNGVVLHWSVIEAGQDRITVAIDAPLANGGRMTRRFVFESPDFMREDDGRYAGMRLRACRRRSSN